MMAFISIFGVIAVYQNYGWVAAVWYWLACGCIATIALLILEPWPFKRPPK